METNKKLAELGALELLAEQLKGKTPTKVSELTNDAGYQTGAQMEEAINAKIAATYKPSGSVAFADMPELAEANLGVVVNVTDGFTTTDNFTEGAGKTYPAGTNVAVVKVGEVYKYDALSGFVDLTGKVDKEDGKGLSTNDYTTEDKTKLASVAEGATKVEASETPGCVKIGGADVQVVEIATDAEVTAMLTRVFGA